MIFSVVVPTHHRLASLQKLIHSLAQQSLDPSQFEVLVVPSPSDICIPWLSEYSKTSRFKLSLHPPMPDPYGGKSASFKRNYGAARAQGEWLAFIDDDCIADPLWLATAALHTDKKDLHGLEGNTKIPVPPEMTLTYKGLQRLSSQGGYQTCNMFYRKNTFLELGGFDLNFPFYLEDTDLAWTFLDHNKQIIFLENAVVHHPVPPPDVKRVLDNAVRVRLLPYLYKKHPEQFSFSSFRTLNTSQWVYIFLYLGSLYSVWASPNKSTTLLAMLALILAYHGAYLYHLLQGCRVQKEEFWQLFFYLPVAPLIALVQLVRGNIENKTFIVF